MEHFLEEFFYLNPISQLGLIATRNKRAEIVSELGGNPKKHMECLKRLADASGKGDPSLQNSLDLAVQTLKNMPSHASREVNHLKLYN